MSIPDYHIAHVSLVEHMHRQFQEEDPRDDRPRRPRRERRRPLTALRGAVSAPLYRIARLIEPAPVEPIVPDTR